MTWISQCAHMLHRAIMGREGGNRLQTHSHNLLLTVIWIR